MSAWNSTDWKLIYEEWSPQQQPLREALCTLGNGHFCTRGAAEERAAGREHYPGTYLAGGYNRLETEIAGRVIENEDLVNWPNWLCLSFRHEQGDWFDLDAVELLEFRQELDLQRGLLERIVRFRDQRRRESTLTSRRLVHSTQSNIAALQWTLTAHNWSGQIELRSALDGTVRNHGVERYRELNSRHLNVLATGEVAEDGIYLVAASSQSHVRMAQAARTRVFCDDQLAPVVRDTVQRTGLIAQHLRLNCEQSKPLRVEKVVAIYSSRDHAISEPLVAARETIQQLGGFDELLESHTRGWSQLWRRCDIQMDGDRRAQLVLRLHVFHLLQTCSMNSVDRDVGVPARGWHGEAYRGHIFWDELFIFPFLNLRIPELTRELLMYRYRRLPAARHAAAEAGYKGAMFPWQSGSSGREETQVVHLNPHSGRWVPDNSHQQRHVNAAIAYNVWQYYQATGDTEFMSFCGVELIVEIARFWSTIATYHPQHDRYEIRGIMGPDEFHTKYPDREELGLDNNAYTNLMAVWVICRAMDALEMLPEDRRQELVDALEIDDEEFRRWKEVSTKMFVPFHGDGIISQFEGYEKLETFDWGGYRAKYGDIQRLDRILEAEGESPNRYQAGKQADVLMLFYLLSTAELAALFRQLGYPFEPEMIPRNVEYYHERTSHGSTLSHVVHSWVLARSCRERSWELFRGALESDIADTQGGTTPEGIHLGAMAGTVDVMQRCFSGIEMHDDVLWLDPQIPDELSQISLRIHYRSQWLRLVIGRHKVVVSIDKGLSKSAKIGFQGQVFTMRQGETREFELE